MPENDKTDPKVAEKPENDLEEAFGKEESPPPEDLDKTVIRGEDEGEEKTPKGKEPLPYLVIVEGPRSGTRFPLSEEKNVIGRSPGCAVRLDDQSVSRNHAEVTQVPGGWSVTDLGSKNGTVVNRSPVTEPVIIGHLDFIKVGIYLLRLVTQEVSVADEMKLPQEMLDVERTDFVETPPPEGITGEEEREAMPEGGPLAMAEPETKVKMAPKSLLLKYRKMIAPVALGISVILIGVYYGQKYFFAEPEKPAKKPPVVEQVKPSAPGVPGVTPTTQTMPVAPPPLQVQKVPLFLDFASSPLPATIMFQGKDMGRAPIRVNVELEAGKQYEAEATFEMPEVSEKYTQKISFVADPQQSVIPLLFRAPIGMIKVNDLPRDVQFYLEGRYEYDRFSERPAKLGEIVLRKPIYIPFGTYTLELRRARQLGASQTYVQDIVYRRQFTMAADSPSQVFRVTDEDLRIFPVVVRSEPRNADVFIDGGPVGKTPYEGNFPLGEHTMTIRKEGYFEYTEVLKVDINTPFVTMVTLQTSVAGAHINNAIAAMNQNLFEKAINELAEALNSSPAPSEIAKANYLLGKCYFALKDNSRALQYFQLARQNAEQKDAALLGMVQVYAALNQKNMALPLLVEAMLTVKDENLKREANGLFQQISPFRSVIYVYTNPPGADVIVNDKKVTQLTPVILHDMSLGTYKLRLEKAGYQPVDLRMNLSVNEFNPVIVDLKPIPQ
jgi:pSer/pThr/pTyr-binding forkhead associated (FHA) protein